MLIADDKQITAPAHRDTWQLIRDRLTDTEVDRIILAIHDKIGPDREFMVPGFMCGADWTGTPFEIIYTRGAKKSETLAALMYGSLAWEAFIRHPERWWTNKTTYAGRDIENRYYVRYRTPGESA